MLYPYKCTVCNNDWDVAKPLRNIDDTEMCDSCGGLGKRCIAASASFSRTSAADWNTQHYNHAFGRSFVSNSEAKKEAKRRGYIEVGNEPVDKIHKTYDTDRQKKLDSRYDGLTDLGDIKS